MAIDLNADMGSVIKGLMGGKKDSDSGDSSSAKKSALDPLKKAILYIVLVLVVLGIYIMAFYMPQKDNIRELKTRIADITQMQKELGTLENQSLVLEKKLTNSRESYLSLLARFGGIENLETIYRAVSKLAADHNLTIENIKKIDQAKNIKKRKGSKSKPGEDTADSKDKKSIKAETSAKTEELKVEVLLKGNFNDYMGFKEGLGRESVLVSVDAEVLKIDQETTGLIAIKLTLITYALDKQPYLIMLSNYIKESSENNEDKDEAETENTEEGEEESEKNNETMPEIMGKETQ